MNLVLSLAWMLRYLCFFMLLDLLCLRVAAQYPGNNRYYSGPGNTSGYCPITSCSYASCQYYQYLQNCNFNLAGSCTNCTNAPSLNYYTSTGQFSNNCAYTPCQTCPDGQYNVGCGGASQGTCSPCTGTLSQGYFWAHNTGPVASCTQQAITSCSAGQYNSGANSTYEGKCVSCNMAACGTGQYLANCGGTSNGTCASCTGANSTQEYSTNGQTLNLSTSCQIAGCVKTCSAGQYITGCGGPVTGLGCAPCTNSVNNVNYYDKDTSVAPAYNATSCSVAACPLCSNGYYSSGCAGTSPGACNMCQNTQ